MRSISRRVSEAMIAEDNSNGERGCSCPLLQPLQHGPGVQERHRGVHRRVERAVHRDQVVRAEELVQLDVVHVTVRADLGGVQHGEHVIVVDVDLETWLRSTQSRTAIS